MFFINGLITSVQAFICGNPESPAEIFKKKLLAFSKKSINQEECIAECIKVIANSLQLVNGNLSKEIQEVIKSYLEKFNQTVDETSFLTKEQTEGLKKAFTNSLRNSIETRWADAEAQSFYSVLEISTVAEKILAAQKWTHHFFEGVYYFNQWKSPFSDLDQDDFVTALQKTVVAFHFYSQAVMQKKMQNMPSQMKNPDSFMGELMQKDLEEAQKTPDALSEQDYFELAKYVLDCETFDWSDIEQKTLLEACIWNGYMIQEFKQSIIDSDASSLLFAGIFNQEGKSSQFFEDNVKYIA